MQIQCTGDFSDREGGRSSPCVKPAPFQMQIQCTGDFSDREGGRSSPCVKPAPFQMQIQRACAITTPRLRPASATAPWPGNRPAPTVHYAKKSSAARGAHVPHAPTDKDTNVPARNRERADVRYNTLFWPEFIAWCFEAWVGYAGDSVGSIGTESLVCWLTVRCQCSSLTSSPGGCQCHSPQPARS
jgi:hypothetical protein